MAEDSLIPRLLASDEVDYLRLLRAILQNRRTVEATVELLDAQRRSVNRWLNASTSEQLLASIEPESKHKIISAANRIGLPFEEFAKGTLIWDFEKSYSENLLVMPDSSFEQPAIIPVRTPFLGYELDSPFGPAASVLMADRFKTLFLMRRWNFIGTTKSFLSRARPARGPRNLAYCQVTLVQNRFLESEIRRAPSYN